MQTLRVASCGALAGVVLVIGAVFSEPACAATKAVDLDRPYWRTNLFKRVATDQKFLLTRWMPHEFKDPWFVSTLGVGLAMVVQSTSGDGGGFDGAADRNIPKATSSGATRVADIFTTLGEGVVVGSILGITYLSARRKDDERLSEASSLAAESLLDAGIWIVVLKSATARVRPNNPNAGKFFQYGGSGSDSFPSGHAMGAFSVASVFAEKYRDKRWVPWLSYGLATAVSASRLVLKRHYPGDVLVGAVLGASIGRGVVARSGEEAPHVWGTFGAAVGPGGRGVGIGWSYSWK